MTKFEILTLNEKLEQVLKCALRDCKRYYEFYESPDFLAQREELTSMIEWIEFHIDKINSFDYWNEKPSSIRMAG